MYSDAVRKGERKFIQDFFKSPVFWNTQRIRWPDKGVTLSNSLPAHISSQGISYAKLHDSSYLCVLTTDIAMKYTLVRQMYKHFNMTKLLTSVISQ